MRVMPLMRADIYRAFVKRGIEVSGDPVWGPLQIFIRHTIAVDVVLVFNRSYGLEMFVVFTNRRVPPVEGVMRFVIWWEEYHNVLDTKVKRVPQFRFRGRNKPAKLSLFNQVLHNCMIFGKS